MADQDFDCSALMIAIREEIRQQSSDQAISGGPLPNLPAILRSNRNGIGRWDATDKSKNAGAIVSEYDTPFRLALARVLV